MTDSELKERARATWAAGDYDGVVDRIWSAGADVVQRVGINEGDDVLDVACGTGNATIRAAKVAARVTGLDFAPRLLGEARERAADAMVEVELVEGDAQALPFEDASFDRVISCFGHMFAPDQRRTAEEMLRVCRPGGRIAIACWTPEGKIGAMFQAIAAVTPPPPEGFQSPLMWGTEQRVRELLGDADFSRHEVEWVDESVERYAQFMESSFGPLINAREVAGDAVHDAYLGYLTEANEADDGSMRFRGEYLVSVVDR